MTFTAYKYYKALHYFLAINQVSYYVLISSTFLSAQCILFMSLFLKKRPASQNTIMSYDSNEVNHIKCSPLGSMKRECDHIHNHQPALVTGDKTLHKTSK